MKSKFIVSIFILLIVISSSIYLEDAGNMSLTQSNLEDDSNYEIPNDEDQNKEIPTNKEDVDDKTDSNKNINLDLLTVKVLFSLQVTRQ